ncbi:serine/threonine-protein kinase [Microbispora bryophytorum]|uniref:Serine/threonine protein kinase n=1 Tax=Microbispora bryophytorum subsp. camponoti TaxID=1677852 RepID=A0ABR8LBJ6_9ACTN|nr:serine/threonine-protein kinase [Microbispora camponoti]MBD3148244.1 serine/threonine protein kinase [Microbispora camponoti]
MARGGTASQNGMPPGVRPLTVGDPVVIGRYLLLGRLGSGGMGVVYLAEHPGGGYVALKTPHPVHLGDPTLRARFAEEVALSRRVVPFCTAAVIEDGLDGERPYLVSEYVPGPALSQVVAARGPLTPDLAYGVALGAAAALVATHEAGLVHRDLKPGNVLLSPHGPFVIDFGIARDLDVAMAHTQAGQIMGSPGWVSPERLRGHHAIPASDVFSWGCLVAFAATGLHPFGAGDLDVLTRRILVEEPRIDAVPKPLRGGVAAALRREPADRPDAAWLLASLLAASGVHGTADPRRAVAAVLDEIWQPVPHPSAITGRAARGRRTRGRDSREAAQESANPAQNPTQGGWAQGGWAQGGVTQGRVARRRAARSRTQVSHAGFAALATVTIAAVTVVAAGAGSAHMNSTADPPPALPVVIPGEDSALPPEDVLGTARPPVVPIVDGARPRVTVTATRTMPPPGTVPGPATEDGGRTPSAPSPSAAGATLRPPAGGHCVTGGPKDCGSSRPSPPAHPDRPGRPGRGGQPGQGGRPGRGGQPGQPGGQPGQTRPPIPPVISQEPQWGDGESPPPSPSPPPESQPPSVVATPAPSIP